MLFDIESFDYSYYDEGSEGLKVALVHHLDMPIMRQTGFHIAPGTENQIAVTPTLISTSPNAMDRFTPEERDCYSEDEISLKYLPRDHGYRYEMSNCLFESAFENILKECKCFPGFHTMGGEDAANHYDVCMGANLTCMNDLMNRMGQFDHVDYNGVQVKCRSNCEDQINSLFVTTSSYPNRKTLVYREEFCIVAKRILDKCDGPKRKPLEREYPNICSILQPLTKMRPGTFCVNNQWSIPRGQVPNCTRRSCPLENAILQYARENLVMFNIFIKDPYAKRFQKDEKITKTSYIANSGGLLGLCMGFSLISGAEILFHCFFGMFSAIFPSEKKLSYLRKNKRMRREFSKEESVDYYECDDPDGHHHCYSHGEGECQHDPQHITSPPGYEEATGSEEQSPHAKTTNPYDGQSCCSNCNHYQFRNSPRSASQQYVFKNRHGSSITMNPTVDADDDFHHHNENLDDEAFTDIDESDPNIHGHDHEMHRLCPAHDFGGVSNHRARIEGIVQNPLHKCMLHRSKAGHERPGVDNHHHQPVFFQRQNFEGGGSAAILKSGSNKDMVVRARNNATCQTVLGNGKCANRASSGQNRNQGASTTLTSLSASSVSSTAATITANHKPGYVNIGPERII